jgi:hypothetical protein
MDIPGNGYRLLDDLAIDGGERVKVSVWIMEPPSPNDL